MPFGIKEGIDFNKVYSDLIQPALEKEGFEVFRADEETTAGNIRSDMFQELLLADLVVADLSIDNPNVWYELGIRHALRERGVVQIKCKREYMPFDVHTDRTLTYHTKNGLPDPEYVDQDRSALSAVCKSTILSWHGRKVSPVYHLLRYLKEPDWKSLRVEEAREFWDKQKVWENYIEIARKRGRAGDILVLADEAPIRFLRMEAYKVAGKALLRMGEFQLALSPIENALSIDPEDIESLRLKATILEQRKEFDKAKEWLKPIVSEENLKKYKKTDIAETWSLLGKIESDMWVNSWRTENKIMEEMRIHAADELDLLEEAMRYYLEGFYLDPSHYDSGINALTCLYLIRYLKKNRWGREGSQNINEDIEEMEENVDYDELCRNVEGGVSWTLRSILDKEMTTPRLSRNFGARIALAEMKVLSGSLITIEKVYKHALAAAEKDRFALESSRQQLLMLRNLGFRPQEVSRALNIVDWALEKFETPEGQKPRLIFLFSGHMIDKPDRKEPRFPPDKEEEATRAIATKLDQLGAGKDDLALSSGSCGGDLLFAEACLKRSLRLEIRIPFPEPIFLRNSVTYAGDKWRDKFYAVKNHQNTRLFILPDELGIAPKEVNPYARNNLWKLYSALAQGPNKVHFISLWNRKEGDGPGGTKHMIDEVSKHFGQVHILDTNVLFNT